MRSTRRCLFDLILNLCLLILKNEEANNGGEADKISLATLIPVRRRSCCWSGDQQRQEKIISVENSFPNFKGTSFSSPNKLPIMKTKYILFLLSVLHISSSSFAQNTQYYKDRDNNTHLTGPFQLKVLETDSNYSKWFRKGYDEFLVNSKKSGWAQQLTGIEVEVFLGTWCGDSQNWVPKFVKTWDQLGLDRKNLRFTALYDNIEGESKYKQGPNREEKNKNIHRVPTFIFYKNGQEISRIVESPVNDLETDLAQIATGIPSKPNYRGASYMISLFNQKNITEIKASERDYFYTVYRLLKGNASELNTLGYVLLEAGRVDEALLLFELNARYFRFDPNVYDSYGEALAKVGQTGKAIEMYERVLLLDRSNRTAAEQLARLRNK